MWVTLDTRQTAVNILTCMQNAGYSPKMTADSLSVSVQSVYYWIRGERIPSYENLITLSILFQVHLEDLLSYKCT